MSKLKKDIGMAKKCDHSNAVALLGQRLLSKSIDDVNSVSIVCYDCDFKIKTSNVYLGTMVIE